MTPPWTAGPGDGRYRDFATAPTGEGRARTAPFTDFRITG